MRIDIKPLSINESWQGRRFKTDKYKAYEKELILKLKPLDVPNGKIRVNISFGFSNSLNDIDNGLKPFLDILQKKYGFNDRDIYELNVKKELTKKGLEYIDFEIIKID